MFDPKAIEKDNRLIKAITGLSTNEFEELLSKFTVVISEEIQRKPRRVEPVLKTDRDKLFYVLFYLKCYPTFDLAGAIYGVNRAQTMRWFHSYKPVLEKTLGRELALPARKVSSEFEFLKMFPAVKEVYVDGTERPINRPKKKQAETYSGKKKLHTKKNLLVADKTKEVLILTKTISGRNHDYTIFKKGDIKIPASVQAFFDLGFYGIENDYPDVEAILPIKKPKGKDLTPCDRLYNRIVSKKRVKIEHTIAGIKRFKCTSDKFRNRSNKTADDFILLSAGLWNFHLKKSA